MQQLILIIMSAVSVLLIISILLQSRGEGLGVIGGGGGGSYHTKRGFEVFLVRITVVLSVIFMLLAVIAVRIGA